MSNVIQMHCDLTSTSAVDPVARYAWFRAKVRDALDDSQPPVPAEEVEARFAKAARRSRGGQIPA